MAADGTITDLVSYYTLPSSVLGNDKYDTLKAAFMYYTVAGATPLQQLMSDALILAHQRYTSSVCGRGMHHNAMHQQKPQDLPAMCVSVC